MTARYVSDYTGEIKLRSGEEAVLDFGDHLVGNLSYSLTFEGIIQDAPLVLELTFGETVRELVDTDKYCGRLSASWIQTERRQKVFLPDDDFIERRFSFRYLRIKRVDTVCNTAVIKNIKCDAVTSADISRLPQIKTNDPLLDKIYRTAALTLMDCEQSVYEDGPKRDRRLWMGDFRLQALSDYMTFRNLDLTKKCLYLFAKHLVDGRIVPQCIYEKSPPFIDR